MPHCGIDTADPLRQAGIFGKIRDVDISLEGMLMAAFTASTPRSQSVWVGSRGHHGFCFAGFAWLASITLFGNQVISGLAINTLPAVLP